MNITGWTEWDNPKYKEMFPIGEPPNTTEDYTKIKEIIAKELRDKGYKFTGEYHQNGDFGVPIFDNVLVYQCTQREWGHIMVKAYPDEIDNSDGMGYCAWAWYSHSTEPEVVPNNADYNLKDSF